MCFSSEICILELLDGNNNRATSDGERQRVTDRQTLSKSQPQFHVDEDCSHEVHSNGTVGACPAGRTFFCVAELSSMDCRSCSGTFQFQEEPTDLQHILIWKRPPLCKQQYLQHNSWRNHNGEDSFEAANRNVRTESLSGINNNGLYISRLDSFVTQFPDLIIISKRTVIIF